MGGLSYRPAYGARKGTHSLPLKEAKPAAHGLTGGRDGAGQLWSGGQRTDSDLVSGIPAVTSEGARGGFAPGGRIAAATTGGATGRALVLQAAGWGEEDASGASILGPVLL